MRRCKPSWGVIHLLAEARANYLRCLAALLLARAPDEVESQAGALEQLIEGQDLRVSEPSPEALEALESFVVSPP